MKYAALTGPGYTVNTCWGLVRMHDDGKIERYDKQSHGWVDDYEMSGIYTGEIDCDPVEKDVADRLIDNWKDS